MIDAVWLQNFFIIPNRNLFPIKQSLPIQSLSLQPLATTSLLLWICLFWVFHLTGIIIRWPFMSDFFSHSIIFSCFSMCQHVIPFYDWIIFHYLDTLYFVYPFISQRYLGFHLLALVNSTVTNIHVQVIIWTPIHSFGIYFGVELLSHSVFNLLRNLPPVFLYSLQTKNSVHVFKLLI